MVDDTDQTKWPQEVYSLQEFVEEFEGAFPEPLSVKEMSRRQACSRPTARAKMNALVDHGVVGKKQVGSRAEIFWLTPGGGL